MRIGVKMTDEYFSEYTENIFLKICNVKVE